MTAPPLAAGTVRPGGHGRTAAGFGLGAAAIAGLGVTLETLDRPAAAVVWGGLALAAFAASLLCLTGAAAGGGLIRWKFGAWTLAWYGVVFGLTTVTWSQPQTASAAQIAVPSVLRALWLVAAGMTALAAGWCRGPGQPARRAARRVLAALQARFSAQLRGPAAPWVLYAIGVAARLSSTATTGVFGYVGDPSSLVSTAAGYGGILAGLSFCAPLALSAATLALLRERRRGARLTLVILCSAELALGAAAGNKQIFVTAVLAVVIPYSAIRRRLPRGTLIAALLVFLIVEVPFNQAYRGTVRHGSATLTPGQAVAAAPQILGQTVTSQGLGTALASSAGYLMQRIRQIDSPAVIMQRTPSQIGFASPVQLAAGPVAGIVPRALWPGKPIMTTGYQFSQQYFGLPATTYTSTGETTVGSLYLHGGWIPVLAGMFLLGCGIRLLDDTLDVRANPHAIFLVLLLLPSLVEGEEDWQAVLTAIPAALFVWVFAVAVTFGPRRRA